MSEIPAETEFPTLNAPPVIPEAFPQWEEVMNTWGSKMLEAVHTVAEILAVGFGLEADTFTQRMKYAPHLLAPTGTNMAKHGDEGTMVAGWHTDISFLTIHGKSRFPGLAIWLRNGKKVFVKIPDGCLLVQAGRQIEYLTGGKVLAGYHELVSTEATQKVVEKKKEAGESLWRSSSTLFSHVASDSLLQPLIPVEEETEKFKPIKAGTWVRQELAYLHLEE